MKSRPLARGRQRRAETNCYNSLVGVVMALMLSASGSQCRAEFSAPQTPATLPRELNIKQNGAWFEVYEILPAVYSIREPGHRERVISYLMVGNERALLFDTGTGIGDIREVVSSLTALPVIVVNSHTHADHIGGNHQFKTIYGLDLETSKHNASGRSTEESQRFVPPRAFSREPPPDFSREAFRIKPFQITHYLEDREVLDLGERRLEVLLTPGHAVDALCLIDREHRFILTGDTFYLGRLFVQSQPSSLETYAASAARLAALTGAVDRVLPAHSTTLLKPLFLTRLDAAFQSIFKQDAVAQGPPQNQNEFKFGNFSIVIPESAFGDS